jgi:hypothetical protein
MRRFVCGPAALFAAVGAALAAGTVTITDGVKDEKNENGQDIICFMVETDVATYYYDKEGGGFTSIVDANGVDWINYHQGNREKGEFRGIPNTGQLHPGYTGGTSWTDDPLGTPLAKATVHTTRNGWGATWEFHPAYAKMTLHTVNGSYWMLYEGTPGGQVGPDDVWWRSDGTSSTCWDDPDWTDKDIPNTSGAAVGSEWVYFADGTLDRSLFLIHNDDDHKDDYWQMGGTAGMTVFGFGRNGGKNMTQPNGILIIGLVESRDYNTVKAHIDAVYTGTVTPPPATRDDVDVAITEHRDSPSPDDAKVTEKIASYREQ